jgi:hypothetical protein
MMDDSPRLIYLLYNPDSIDELVLSALQNKWSNAELVSHYLNQKFS